MSNRRDFIRKAALIGLGSVVVPATAGNLQENLDWLTGDASKFELPPLPYAYNALEPFIDQQTMEIHHKKHHQAYIDKLNGVINETDMNIDDAQKCAKIDANSSPTLRNNLGGYYNHKLFWQMMAPASNSAPGGALKAAIEKQFKDVDSFKKEFSEKATKVFGSGWCWLIKTANGELKITTTPNQDNPLMKVAADQGKPLLAIDVWEHAYYLKYQNKRAEYISSWWNVVNWKYVEQQFA